MEYQTEIINIEYIEGDATEPKGEGPHIIVHCCNDLGAWGSGFVVALSKKWPEPEKAYSDKTIKEAIKKERGKIPLELGDADVIQVEGIKEGIEIYVANIIGQHRIGFSGDIPPIRYEALRIGFKKVIDIFNEETILEKFGGMCIARKPLTIHMPRLGCGLAGGDWALIEPLIQATFCKAKIIKGVCVYTFPGGSFYDSRVPKSSPIMRKT